MNSLPTTPRFTSNSLSSPLFDSISSSTTTTTTSLNSNSSPQSSSNSSNSNKSPSITRRHSFESINLLIHSDSSDELSNNSSNNGRSRKSSNSSNSSNCKKSSNYKFNLELQEKKEQGVKQGETEGVEILIETSNNGRRRLTRNGRNQYQSLSIQSTFERSSSQTSAIRNQVSNIPTVIKSPALSNRTATGIKLQNNNSSIFTTSNSNYRNHHPNQFNAVSPDEFQSQQPQNQYQNQFTNNIQNQNYSQHQQFQSQAYSYGGSNNPYLNGNQQYPYSSDGSIYSQQLQYQQCYSPYVVQQQQFYPQYSSTSPQNDFSQHQQLMNHQYSQQYSQFMNSQHQQQQQQPNPTRFPSLSHSEISTSHSETSPISPITPPLLYSQPYPQQFNPNDYQLNSQGQVEGYYNQSNPYVDASNYQGYASPLTNPGYSIGSSPLMEFHTNMNSRNAGNETNAEIRVKLPTTTQTQTGDKGKSKAKEPSSIPSSATTMHKAKSNDSTDSDDSNSKNWLKVQPQSHPTGKIFTSTRRNSIPMNTTTNIPMNQPIFNNTYYPRPRSLMSVTVNSGSGNGNGSVDENYRQQQIQYNQQLQVSGNHNSLGMAMGKSNSSQSQSQSQSQSYNNQYNYQNNSYDEINYINQYSNSNGNGNQQQYSMNQTQSTSNGNGISGNNNNNVQLVTSRLEDGEVLRRSGIVKFFNIAKGFGFILDDDTSALGNRDIFVHYTAIIMPHGFRCLSTNEAVEYDTIKSTNSGGYQALNVTGAKGVQLKGLTEELYPAAAEAAAAYNGGAIGGGVGRGRREGEFGEEEEIRNHSEVLQTCYSSSSASDEEEEIEGRSRRNGKKLSPKSKTFLPSIQPVIIELEGEVLEA